MSTEKRYTERELVHAQRKAFMAGSEHGKDCDASHPCACSEEATVLRYPLPKVTRPRVVKDSDGYEWRATNGRLEWKGAWTGAGWDSENSAVIRSSDVPILAALLANPTETVDDMGELLRPSEAQDAS